MNSHFSLNCQGRLHYFRRPVVMGIVNLTPDSFYPDSRKMNTDAALQTVAEMKEAGAEMIDIGAQSSRPGAEWLGAEEEWERMKYILPKLVEVFPELLFSVDTFHSQVAKLALENGAHIINDISGGQFDDTMLTVVGEFAAPYICMHTKGKPAEMAKMNQYCNILVDIMNFFTERIKSCHKAGINDVILDPGFGFAKNVEQNFELLHKMEAFRIFDCPLLFGISRKSLIYRTVGGDASRALNGTTVLNTVGLQKGAAILRVHDVKEAVEAISLLEEIEKYS